jgi:hypothetical protein
MPDDLWRIVCGLGALCEQEQAAQVTEFRMAPRKSLPFVLSSKLGPDDLWTAVHPDGQWETYPLAIVKDGERWSAESIGDGFRFIDDDDQVWQTLRLPEGGPMVWQRVG